MAVSVNNCSSPDKTEAIGELFGKTLKKGDVVVLDGDMGAGKTVFTKGIARALGITETVTSPTYAYMNDYKGVLYHYDCYRLTCGEQAEALGLTDYFYSDGICVIEWAENISDVLPQKYKRVKIEKIGENDRRITIYD